MEEFKQYLNDNDDEAERRAAEQVMEGLQGLRLEAKVAEVAAERATLYRRLRWRRIVTSMVALALLAGAAYLFFVKNDTPAPQQPVEQPAKPPFPVVNQDVPSENTTEKTASDPIAQLPPDERLPNPRYPAPDASMMRGDDDADKKQQALLDQLWYTDYPLKGLKPGDSFKKVDESLKKRNFNAAYLELEILESRMPMNDTLRYLKAYCLLETGEGNEALAYLDSIQGRHSAWEPQLQWYRGLAMLLADEREQALALFQQLETRSKHPYRRQAEKATGLLSK